MYDIGTNVFENWTITSKLGSGSFGSVYALQREDFGVTYRSAMKVIRIPQSQDEIRALENEGMSREQIRAYFYDSVTELVHEFAIMARLKATGNVVSYEDHKVEEHEDGIGWDILIRMELLTPLLDYAYQHPFARRDVIRLGMDICRALELCQKYNIIHRDIKPDNIFVSENGDFKLGDFGIARTIEKTTYGLSKKGTYNYMAPEIYTGGEYGFSVDTYALGIVLYRLLNRNRIPFLPEPPRPITPRDREEALIRRITGAAMPAPYYAQGRLGEIVLKACAHNPVNRYSSPMQMRQELEAILYSETDAQLIYPEGDEIALQKNDYVSLNSGTITRKKQADVSKSSVKEKDTVLLSGSREEDTAVSTEEKQPERTAAAAGKPAPRKKKKRAPVLIALLLAAVLGVAGVLLRYTKENQQKRANYDACMSQAEDFRITDPDTALALYRNAQKLFPEEENPYILYAYTLYDARRYSECTAYIETDLELGKRFSDSGQSQLCEILGAAYFELEDYAAAASFFRLSAAGSSITVSAMRDYAVSLGRLGDLQGAAAIMEKMNRAGASGAVMTYVQAEIDYSMGNYLLAEEGFTSALKTAAEPALQHRALRSLGELYQDCIVMEQTGESPVQEPAVKAIRILEEGIRKYHLETDSTLVEMLAMVYYEAAQACEDEELFREYLTQSAEHFAMVLRMGLCEEHMMRNLYIIYYELGDYEKAGEYLDLYQDAFPQNYTPHALRAILLITMENEKPQEQRDYSQAAEEYRIAGTMLRSTDEQSYYHQIQGLIEQLEKNGWL